MTERGPEPEEEPGSGFDLLRDPAVVRVLAHPTREQIYREAVKAPVSPKEVAERLEQPLSRVSYHVKALADAGLLRPVRHTRRRGAVETHYRAIATIDIDDEALRALPVEVRQMLFSVPVRTIADDLVTELRGDALDAPDLFISRAHFVATASGRRRLHDEVVAMYRRLAELAEELRLDAEAQNGPVEELNVVLMNYAGVRRAGRNSPYMVTWEDPAAEHLETIPPD